jgi:hypothetical protein
MWMAGTRLRQGFAGPKISRGRRSFSEGGKPGHDELRASGAAITWTANDFSTSIN